MDKAAAIESFFREYGITELQISTILKLFESYLADSSLVKGDGVFEVYPKCVKVHPVIVKGGKAGSGNRCTDARTAAEGSRKIMVPSCITPIREMMDGRSS